MKIIASDYDGTFNHKGIDEKKRTAIKNWREKGNKFGIVSGRMADDLFRIYKKDELELDFLLACNGAVILTTDGKILLIESGEDGKVSYQSVHINDFI